MKQAIRRELLRRRNSFSPEEILAGSRIIADRLTTLKDYQEAEIVMFYASCGSEVSTDEMIEKALKNNRRVAVPLVRPEDRTMRAVLIHDPDRDLFPGFKGIREPDPGSGRELSADGLGLIIVPGVAFDSAGNRVGMGKGYYDRFLKHLSRGALKIALAFENQIVATIPGDDNDIKMDMVITEERVICCT
jgi:5-formyltetrahydrofolate cyclo-ligase